MQSGKALVLGSVLTFPGSFRAKDVVNATDLSRQLVNAHLKSIVEVGGLEKLNNMYVVKDKEALINLLVGESDTHKEVVGLVREDTKFLTPAALNRSVMATMGMVRLDLPGSTEMKYLCLHHIDDAIEQLRTVRRYMNTRRLTKRAAIRAIDRNLGENVEEAYKNLPEKVRSQIDWPTWSDAYDNALSNRMEKDETLDD